MRPTQSPAPATTLIPYPAYKDSGVTWLGHVPEHWEVRPNRSLFKLLKQPVGTKASDYMLLSLTLRGVIARNMVNPEGKFPVEFDTYQEVSPGDLVFCLFDIDETPRCVGLSDLPGMITGAYTVVRPINPSSSKFLYHYYLSLDQRKALKPAYTGLRKVIQRGRFLSIKTPLPPLDEQRAIADFLDGMDARITRFIAARRKMIALLEEQKQAVINQAVTRGLDPDVPLKDSGVDWLGELPAHWEVRRLKDFLREVDERSVAGEEELLSVSHLTGVTPRSEKNITMFKAESYAGHKLCRPGDIVANTMWLWMGAIGTAHHTGIVSSSYAVYRPTNLDDSLPGYLDILLRTRRYVSEYQRQSTGIRSSRLRLYPEQFLRLKIATPALEEQQGIVDHIDRESARIDALISRHRREIELMQEYRTRLISDVVTGKLDVREVELPAVETVVGAEIEAAMEDETIPEEVIIS